MSRGEMGVAAIAWKTLFQISPPMIGKVASNEAVCMAVAARRPGARKSRYGTPPSDALFDTYEPRPRPIAVRNRTGEMNELKSDDR